MKFLLSGGILLHCVLAFAGVSREQAHDFAVRFVEIRQSDQGIEKLKALINNGAVTNGQVGWSENYWSAMNTKPRYDLRELEVNRIFIREPDSDKPMQIELTDYESAKCSIPPEKIAVLYFSNRQKTIRAVLTMALFSNHGKIIMCPMLVESSMDNSIAPVKHVTKEIPFQKNLSTVPGVEIIKIGDDDDCYGFPPPKGTEEESKILATLPLGCSLRDTILDIGDEGVWVKGLDYLPSGRFKIHCELQTGENESVTNKLLNALASTFGLKMKMDDHYTWSGYQVSAPNPLPRCFRVTKEAVGQAAMHGEGDYEGYSLKEILAHALHNKPFDLVSTNSTVRYDVHLELWPEAYGEMTALEQLGFGITQTNLQRKTLVIGPR